VKPPRLENFQGKLCFQASASCSKILNDKKYIYSELRAHSVFQGKRKLLKKTEGERIFNTVKIFRANFAFQGKRKVAQKS